MNGFAQGFSTLQLDRATAVATGRQLDAFTRLGLTPSEPRLADPHGAQGSPEVRARSYLHVNCGVCHRYNSGGVVPAYMNIETPLKEAKLVDAKPALGELGLPEARVIAPGDPARSVLLYRMATAGRGHMPYLGGNLADDRGLLLMRDWIAGMKPGREITAATRALRGAENLSIEKLKAGDAAQLDPLLATGSGALSVLLAITDGSLAGDLRAQAIAKGSVLADPLRRGLFERFQPESQRRTPLGANFDRAALLVVKGGAARGKLVFAGVCAACHRIGDAGTDFGPDLARIGAKWNRAAMLEQIIEPSKIIEPQWLLTTVELRDGSVKAGFLTSRTENKTTLKLPGGVTENIPAVLIAKINTTRVSLMPEGLLQNLTAQEASDLLEYLATLK
jgi:putative heme-binding domain-containing protein